MSSAKTPSRWRPCLCRCTDINVLHQREDETDEEDGEASGDFIGERLAHARLEATGQLYREVRGETEGGLFSVVLGVHN